MAAGEIIQGVRWLRDAAGKLVGYRNPVTDKDEDLNAAAVQALVSGAGSVAVTHDGSGRVATVAKAGGRSYTYTYPTGQIVITANDGAVATADIDGASRVTWLTGNFP